VTACFSPKAPSEVPCDPNGGCPAGQTCTPEGLCSSTPFVPGEDAPLPPADSPVVPADGPTPDTPAVLPLISFGERNGSLTGTWFDTFLEQNTPAANMGVHADLHLVANTDGPILIRVDVSAIPAFATVTAARLRFRVIAQSIAANTKIEVFEMNESWTEGTKDFEDGVANYTQRNNNAAWSTAGAQPPSRDSTPVATVTIPALIATGGELEISLPAALVTSWVTTPNTNHGIAMIVDGSSFYCELGSSEAAASNDRPVLEVELE
jgi:hypothetical protein